MSMPAEQMTATITLDRLLAGMADAPPLGIADIASDSRYARAGGLFLACRGGQKHALEYLDAGLAQALAAIAWDGDASVRPPAGVTAVEVPGLRAHMGEIANRFFDTPSQAVDVAAVTGTNGKTTVAWLLAQCWELLGRPAGYIGTLGSGLGTLEDSGGLTTPDCIELQRRLARFRDAGATAVAIEASSHALAQGRLAGTHVATALFTNLSRDHIDYHGDMASYGESKAALFADYDAGLKVICIDSEFGRDLAARHHDAVLVASDGSHDPRGQRFVFAQDVNANAAGSKVAVRSSFGNGTLELPLYGRFNVANALQVLATLLCADVAIADACELMQNVTAPPGRMEQVQVTGDKLPRVFVDYAHTPAALEAALQALAPHCRGRLWCLFGCGGDRDRGKRPLMGAAVEAGADIAVLTSDNPRSEDPAAIMRDVQAGMRGDVIAIEDRAAAIAYAVRRANADDVLLIAGKGHEDYQDVGGTRLSFSDRAAAAANLRRRQS